VAKKFSIEIFVTRRHPPVKRIAVLVIKQPFPNYPELIVTLSSVKVTDEMKAPTFHGAQSCGPHSRKFKECVNVFGEYLTRIVACLLIHFKLF